MVKSEELKFSGGIALSKEKTSLSREEMKLKKEKANETIRMQREKIEGKK